MRVSKREKPIGLYHDPAREIALAMRQVLSTHLFLNQRLRTDQLAFAESCRAQSVEIYAARQHFDYTSREQITELVNWFRSSTVTPFSLHAPRYPDYEMGRSGAPLVNLLHPEKARRIGAMDEIKRAIESAEQIPFENLILHLGDRNDEWSQYALEYSLTAIEHLGAFARPLGVRILLENLVSEAAAPERLMAILEIGHFNNVGICLDLGHANITVGVAEAIAVFGDRIASVHVHDNHGEKDEHLWPGDGTIDWQIAVQGLKKIQVPPVIVPEIHPALAGEEKETQARVEKVFAMFE